MDVRAKCCYPARLHKSCIVGLFKPAKIGWLGTNLVLADLEMDQQSDGVHQQKYQVDGCYLYWICRAVTRIVESIAYVGLNQSQRQCSQRPSEQELPA
jgi:hypothetical protein